MSVHPKKGGSATRVVTAAGPRCRACVCRQKKRRVSSDCEGCRQPGPPCWALPPREESPVVAYDMKRYNPFLNPMPNLMPGSSSVRREISPLADNFRPGHQCVQRRGERVAMIFCVQSPVQEYPKKQSPQSISRQCSPCPTNPPISQQGLAQNPIQMPSAEREENPNKHKIKSREIRHQKNQRQEKTQNQMLAC